MLIHLPEFRLPNRGVSALNRLLDRFARLRDELAAAVHAINAEIASNASKADAAVARAQQYHAKKQEQNAALRKKLAVAERLDKQVAEFLSA